MKKILILTLTLFFMQTIYAATSHENNSRGPKLETIQFDENGNVIEKKHEGPKKHKEHKQKTDPTKNKKPITGKKIKKDLGIKDETMTIDKIKKVITFIRKGKIEFNPIKLRLSFRLKQDGNIRTVRLKPHRGLIIVNEITEFKLNEIKPDEFLAALKEYNPVYNEKTHKSEHQKELVGLSISLAQIAVAIVIAVGMVSVIGIPVSIFAFPIFIVLDILSKFFN